jgi:hypothetical protein
LVKEQLVTCLALVSDGRDDWMTTEVAAVTPHGRRRSTEAMIAPQGRFKDENLRCITLQRETNWKRVRIERIGHGVWRLPSGCQIEFHDNTMIKRRLIH